MNRFELFVALRYLRARRKQAVISVITFISIGGVTAGVAALIIALSLNAGFQSEFQKRILGATSHVNLLKAGALVIPNYDAVLELTRTLPGVEGVTPSVYAQSLLQSDLRQRPAVLKGILVAEESVSAEMFPPMVEGSVKGFNRTSGLSPIVLGKELAQGLGVAAGETIRAFGMGGELSPLGRMPRVRSFQVIAIFESGLWDFDSNWALVPIPAAQRFCGMTEDQATCLEFRIRDIYAAGQFAEALKQTVGEGYITNTWIELNRPLFSALRLEKLAMFVAIGLIVLVASLNIVSTLTLMVMEKNRDIAIITAMGGTTGAVTRVFMLQGLIIGLVGTALGDLLACGAVWYMDRYRVFALEPQVYSIPYVPFRLEWGDVALVSLVAVVVSFLATLYPARAAAKLDPVEAIRYE